MFSTKLYNIKKFSGFVGVVGEQGFYLQTKPNIVVVIVNQILLFGL